MKRFRSTTAPIADVRPQWGATANDVLGFFVAVTLVGVIFTANTVASAEETTRSTPPEDPPKSAADAAPGTRIGDPFAPLPPEAESERAADAEAVAGTDRIYLDDGSLIQGRLGGFRDCKLRISSPSLGNLRIEPKQVSRFSLERERIFYVQEEAGEPSEAIIVSVGADGQLTRRTANTTLIGPLDFGEIVEMRPSPIPTALWTARVTATASADFGNSDSLSFGFSATVNRESKQTFLGFNFEFSFVETDSRVSRRLIVGGILYRYYFSSELGVFVEDRLRKDVLSGIKLRNAVQGGGTYRPLAESDAKLAFDLGLTYTFESLVGSEIEYFGGVLALSTEVTVLKTETTRIWSIAANVNFNMDFADFSRWTLVATVETKLALNMNFAIGFRMEDTWQGRPAAGFKRNDLRILLTVTFEIREE